MRIGALPACRGVQPMLLRGCDAFKMIAGGAYCTSAKGQKGLNLPKRTQAKPRRAPKPPRRNLGERRSAGVNGGLHDAEYEGTNAQVHRKNCRSEAKANFSGATPCWAYLDALDVMLLIVSPYRY